MALTEAQTVEIGDIAEDPILFLKYVRIQEPGQLSLKYELWPHLVSFYQALERYNLIILTKSKQIGVCLDPSTLVLTADLRWVTLNSIQEGDTLVSVDEYPKKGKGKKRCFRKSTVLVKSEIEKPAYLVKTTLGDIIATAEHRFLACPPSRWSYKWRSIDKAKRTDGKLQPGYKIRMVTLPWGEATYEDGWFGGMLDGEGCLRGAGKREAGIGLSVSQLPGDVLERCKNYLADINHYCASQITSETRLGRIADRLEINALHSVFKIIGKCRPTRFVSRTDWWEGLSLNNIPSGEILSIKPLGLRRMIDLMTSTGTFIANGFISHNSWALAVRALRKLYTVPGSNRLMLSSGQKEAQDLLEKVRIIYHNLPEWMKVYTLEPNSSERFGFKELGSMITALPSTEKAGIGVTADGVDHDEAEFHDCFEINLGHTLATVADKATSQLTVVSTVDKTKPDSYFKKLFKGARGSGYPEEGTNNFQALFYPYNVRPGRDEIWYEEESKKHQDKLWEMEAHYPKTVKEALSPLSASSCFKKEILDKLWANAINNPENRQGFIHILHPPAVGTPYIAGVDVGEGIGRDYSVLTIVGKQGLSAEVAAVIYTNTLGTDFFAFEVDKLCREYFNPLLVVDNIGVGRAVVDGLVKLGYPNLFYADKERKRVGWSLTRPNKRELTSKLVEVINNESLITKFKPMIKELMEYQWINGYPEPTGKTHGDTVSTLQLIMAAFDKIGVVQKASYWVRGRQIW